MNNESHNFKDIFFIHLHNPSITFATCLFQITQRLLSRYAYTESLCHDQDVIKGQFLNGGQLIGNQCFPSRLYASLKLKNQVSPTIYPMMVRGEMNLCFSKEHQCDVKHKQHCSGFEYGTTIPLPSMIIVTQSAFPSITWSFLLLCRLSICCTPRNNLIMYKTVTCVCIESVSIHGVSILVEKISMLIFDVLFLYWTCVRVKVCLFKMKYMAQLWAFVIQYVG